MTIMLELLIMSQLAVSTPHWRPAGDTCAHRPEDQVASIHCLVQLDREAPPLPRILPDKDVTTCSSSLLDPILIARERSIQNAVVWIESIEALPPPVEPMKLDLLVRGCLFEPRVQVGRTGAVLTLHSEDPLTHNPHAWLDDSTTIFNITILDPSLSFKKKLRKAGIYRVDCDTHSWMRAYVAVFDHPWFGKTDSTGLAIINGVSAGNHVVHVWHEVLGEEILNVSVEQNTANHITVILPLRDVRSEKLRPATVASWPVLPAGESKGPEKPK